VNVINDAKPPAPGGRSMLPVSTAVSVSPLCSVIVLRPVKNTIVGTSGSPGGMICDIVNA
jgi:hypothetical protein